MASATPRRSSTSAGAGPAAVESPIQASDPARGARRREGLLLGAFAVLFVIGVWTVVVAELMPEPADMPRHGKVAEPTQNPQSAGK